MLKKSIKIAILSFLVFSVNSNAQKPNQKEVKVTIEAEHFIEHSGNITKEASLVKTTNEDSWLSYKVSIPVSGRYMVRVYAKNQDIKEANIWLEDYIDNKDYRIYNVTGNMAFVDKKSPLYFQIDGAPLATKSHLMKLHISNCALSIDKIEFILMISHKASPIVIKQKTDGKIWSLKWSDEFNGKGLPDQKKWTYDIGNWGWGNNELEYYTDKKVKNARQENGNLIIEAVKDANGQTWSSARLTTRGKTSFLYGKIEFRAKVPKGRGSWAAGWTLGDSYIDELSWPYCGEFDILENVGYEMDPKTSNGKTHGSVHYENYYFKKGNQIPFIADVKNMTGEYHTYALVWLPTGATMYVDGEKYFDYPKNEERTKTWPFDRIPQNIIINLAMGGGWGGAKGVDSKTLTSQKMIVDYVRVYELK